jgi:nucleoside-diphosphate-sugar epimerase
MELPAAQALGAQRQGSVAAFRGYLAVRRRGIQVPEERLLERLAGRTVLVTGATGCVGMELVSRLGGYEPGRIVGVSLDEAPRDPVVQHHRLDLRDEPALTALLRRIRPDVVFHLAAQRDPGLAERAVRLTVSTNVLATRGLIRACIEAGVEQLVYASAGRALLPYTSEVGAQSKRAGEWLVADAAGRGQLTGSAARFAHVVDNALVLERFRQWCARGEALRVHRTDDSFYVQSARECAQLLLVAALAPVDERFRVHAVRDTGWPMSVLDLAVGVIAEQGIPVPVHEVGPEPGYGRHTYPGLYDPVCSTDVSPLLNGMEAPAAEASGSADVDSVPLELRLTGPLRQGLDRLARLCAETRDEEAVRAAFDTLSWELLRASLLCTPVEAVRAMAVRTEPHWQRMTAEQLRIDQLVRERAGL